MFSTLNMHRSYTTNSRLLYPVFILFSSICTRKKDLHSSKSNTFSANSQRNTFNRFSSRQNYLKGKRYQSKGGVLFKWIPVRKMKCCCMIIVYMRVEIWLKQSCEFIRCFLCSFILEDTVSSYNWRLTYNVVFFPPQSEVLSVSRTGVASVIIHI